MLIQNLVSSDSSKVIQDSIKSAADNEVINSLGFDLTNIGNNEIMITILGYGIVFVALLVLYMFFSWFTKILLNLKKKRLKAAGKKADTVDDLSVPESVTAAIAMALSLHFQEAHDLESTIITIKKVQNTYSPWNSKIHGLRQYPKY